MAVTVVVAVAVTVDVTVEVVAVVVVVCAGASFTWNSDSAVQLASFHDSVINSRKSLAVTGVDSV
jgi:hypothetical protein